MSPSPVPEAAARPDLLTPEELAALGGLELQARVVVEGFLTGLHRSPHRGFSAEFAELRGYRPGDDLRHIDWRMYARSDRYYVKQFEEETNLRAYLVVDGSASMEWSSRPGSLPPKLEVARLLAAALALLMIRQGDRVGMTIFDRAPRDWVPARGGRSQWNELARRLVEASGTGGTDPAAALERVARRLTRRGLVVLVSDLLLDPERAVRALAYLRHRGHQVLVFHLLDPGERDLSGAGDTRFRDPETGEELRVDVGQIRAEYRRGVDAALAEWRRALRTRGMGYHVVGTEEPVGRTLRAFLETRGRLG